MTVLFLSLLEKKMNVYIQGKEKAKRKRTSLFLFDDMVVISSFHK